MSATAGLPTVLGNYDLRYLKERLGKNFRTLSSAAQDAIRQEMEKLLGTLSERNRAGTPAGGRPQVVDQQELPIRERLKEVFGSDSVATRYENRFSARGVRDYDKKRYCGSVHSHESLLAAWRNTGISLFESGFACFGQSHWMRISCGMRS